jgi:hypothetical protein
MSRARETSASQLPVQHRYVASHAKASHQYDEHLRNKEGIETIQGKAYFRWRGTVFESP